MKQQMNSGILETAINAVRAEHGALAASVLEQIVMHSAWDVVAPKPDWKGPVNATVDPTYCLFTAELIRDAVHYMTATPAVIEGGGPEGRDAVTIRAPGYRAGPAA